MMKSFSIDQSTYFIDTVQALNAMNQQNVHQLSRPQKISNNILKAFEKRKKKVKIITEEGLSYMTHIISVDLRELVIRLPDALKIRFNSHLLLVFPTEGKDYVVQGFVKKVFLPIVVLAYADPRFGKRWMLKVETVIRMFPVADAVLDMFMKEAFKLIRRVDLIRPETTATSEEKNRAALAIEDVLCTDVVVDPEPEDEKDVVVYDYEEAEHSDAKTLDNMISGRIYDISPSGLAMLAKKGNEPGEVGGLVYLEFQDLLSEHQKDEIKVFKLRLFGIVRYQRPFGSEDEQIFGIKFLRTIHDPRFMDFLEKTGHSPN